MASTASAASGSIFGALGAINQGQSQGNALDTSAQINRQNAELALQTGDYDAARQSRIADQKIGGATAAYGASGVTSDSGSVMAVIGASHANAEMDRLNILHGAQVKAINYENQASIEETGASNARSAGYLNAISSIMMGGSKVFGNSAGASTSYTGGGGASEGEGDSEDADEGDNDVVD